MGIYTSEIQNIQQKFNTLEANKKYILKSVKRLENSLVNKQKYYEATIQARTFLQEVAEQTQKHIEVHISSIVTSAIQSVFDSEDYGEIKFVTRFEKRRNKTECDLLFEDSGEEFVPLESSGGGLLDITSIALRIAFWTISKTRNTIILDEPGKFISEDLQYKVSAMLKMLSEKLNIQFIVVSHQRDMIESADKQFNIKSGGLINE